MDFTGPREVSKKNYYTRHSAGILTYAVCPKTNGIYFLLGKEGHKYSQIANKWSDFSGMVDKQKDRNVLETAAREFVEETMSIVPITTNGRTASIYRTLVRELSDRKYLFKIESKNDVKKYKRTHKHTTFVKKIQFDPSLPHRFQQTRFMIQKLKTLGTQIRNCRTQFEHLHAQEQYFVNTMLLITSQCELQRYAENLPSWVFSHPSIKFEYTPCSWGRQSICGVSVEEEYIFEKIEIGWWSVPRLEHLVQSSSLEMDQCLRKCFIPTLKLILKEIEKILV